MIRRAGYYFWGNQNWPALKTLRDARDFIACLDHEKQKKREIERRAHVKRVQKHAARSRAKRRARAG